MTDVKKFKIELIKSDLHKRDVAAKLGITIESLNNKIQGRSEFKQSEIAKLIEILHIEKPGEIFFSTRVDTKSTESDNPESE